VYRHKWSLFSACAPIGTTCSLCKRVCSYQLASSSDVFGSFFFPCRWNLCQACEWNSSCFAAWLTTRGYRLTPLFFSVALVACITLPPKWGNSWGSLVLTSSSLPTFLKCLGKLEGRLLRLGLEHSLDGLLHRTRAIGEACCFLHKALFPHPIPSCTALESSYSWGCLLTCP